MAEHLSHWGQPERVLSAVNIDVRYRWTLAEIRTCLGKGGEPGEPSPPSGVIPPPSFGVITSRLAQWPRITRRQTCAEIEAVMSKGVNKPVL